MKLMSDGEKPMTWEQTVVMFRSDPEKREFIYLCYLDDPLTGAAERFADSDEWKAVQKHLPDKKGNALDNVVGSYLLAFSSRIRTWTNKTPGRFYSFVSQKP